MANDRCQCCTKKTLNAEQSTTLYSIHPGSLGPFDNIRPGSLGSFANKYIEQECQSEAL